MELNLVESSEDLEQLHKFVNEWIVNREKDENGLLGLRNCNDLNNSQMFAYLMKIIEKSDEMEIICCAWLTLKQIPFPNVQSPLVQVLHYLLSNLLNSSQHNWKMHQNWCWLIGEIDEIEYQDIINNLLFDYLFRLANHCDDHMPTKLCVVLTIEKLCLKGKLMKRGFWENEQINSLMDKLLGHHHKGALPDNVDHFDRYQVDWCVRWCVDNVMGSDGRVELPLVKLSQGGFEARNDDEIVNIGCANYYNGESIGDQVDRFHQSIMSHPVRSLFPVSCGVYYYEVTIVTSGEMMFGWATRETRLEYDNCEIGQDEQSIGFDAARKLIVHNSQEIKYPHLPDCVAGDVIGCLIDCDARRFVFYYRGHEMELVGGEDDAKVVGNSFSNGITFLKSPYYATATLSSHQQCHFNFGQSSPFKFAPKNSTFKHFHEATGEDGSKYRLTESVITDRYCEYWFKHCATVDNQLVDAFYCDQTQYKFDKMVKWVEKDIRNNRDIMKWRIDDLEIKEAFKCARYIQSIIEGMSKVIGDDDDDKVDVVAMWIWKVFEALFDQANKEKLYELLYPYLQLGINSSQDATKHRYICIVLSHLIKYSQSFHYDFIKPIRSEVFTYLTRTLTETNDKWTHLFVLIALDNLQLNKWKKIEIRKKAKLNHLFHIDYHQQNVLQILKSTNKFVDYQVYLCAQLYNERTFCTTLNQVGRSASFDELIWQTPQPDRSEELKLSRDRLSARSDWQWQSVRSTSCDIHYYEVLLLTSGPMRIGWATKRTNLNRTEIGDDQFSIALDGFNQCVWHNREAFPVRSMSNRWRAGDIVGCRFDKRERAFYFSLNGQPLTFDCSIYISNQPYYAATSLYSHQQCYFYLGQFKFNYKLKSSKEAVISNSLLNNSIININSTSTIGDVSFNAQESTVSMMNIRNEMRQILPIFNRSFNKQGFPWDDDGATLICQLCHKQVCFKRLKTDCCEHFRFVSTETPSTPQTMKALPNIGTPLKDKTSPEQTHNCQYCDQIIQGRPLQFAGCGHGKICRDCVSIIFDCPKCKRMLTNVEQTSIECQHCDQIIQSRALQFADCVHGKMCRDCVSIIFDCPKCRRLGK